ncbi:MAG: hypothetical protein ACHQQS_04575 [Thermoanaerobaculales bacterium]
MDATGEIQGIRGADGTPMAPVKIHVYVTMVEKGGKWLIEDARPCIYPPPPGPPPTAAK